MPVNDNPGKMILHIGAFMSSDQYRYGAHLAVRAMHRALLELRRFRQRRSAQAASGERCFSPMTVFRQAAEPLGIELRDLGCEAFELRHGEHVRRFQGMTSNLENAFAYWATGHKHMTFELLRRAGVSELPRYQVHSLASAEAARREFRQRGRAVVVKPCFGTSRGLGVTVGISDERELNRAIYTALCHDRQYMVEDFVAGENYRLLVLSGRLLSAVRRIPASVTGDGAATLRQLIERENARRSLDRGPTALFPIALDDDLRHHLKTQGKSLRSVPGREERVFVKSISNFCSGAETEEVTERVCGATHELCRRVAAELGIVLAGIDIITQDIARPLAETGGVINEVNTSPALNLHYAVRNADQVRDVAREILLEMFPSAGSAP